ncbi:MAG: type I-C CRISPR-associated protein Cas7/Csd2 [Bacillota bacterium]
MNNPIANRYEFVLFFDVENGNPNGDPDAGNMPRVDFETGQGLVTDVCIKRKIRDYIDMKMQDQDGYHMLIKQDNILINRKIERAVEETAIELDKGKIVKKDAPTVAQWICAQYYDVRAFGAVISVGAASNIGNYGQIRGPVQMGFAKSIDPVFPQEITITRVSVTSEKDSANTNTMGRKHIVPYGLYRMDGYVSAMFAQKNGGITGFSESDLELLWEAMENMFEHDHSAARGKMALRKLIIFKHDSALGNAPAHKLFDLIRTGRTDETKAPRKFADYRISIDREGVPAGVTLIERV